jgi:hypothetical protein
MPTSPEEYHPAGGTTASALGSEVGEAIRDLWLAVPPDVRGPLLAFVHALGDPSSVRAGLELGTDSVRLAISGAVNDSPPEPDVYDDGPRSSATLEPVAIALHIQKGLGEFVRMANAAGLTELALTLDGALLAAQTVEAEQAR